jgi:hypothetical protein
MERDQSLNSKKSPDRIEENRIILDGDGRFPKKVIILESSEIREYQIVRTKRHGYLLTK